jgi:hypothetical protein
MKSTVFNVLKRKSILLTQCVISEIYRITKKSRPIGVYWFASVLMRVETGFSICFVPSLLKISDDVITAIEGAFSKTDNEPKFGETLRSSIHERI